MCAYIWSYKSLYKLLKDLRRCQLVYSQISQLNNLFFFLQYRCLFKIIRKNIFGRTALNIFVREVYNETYFFRRHVTILRWLFMSNLLIYFQISSEVTDVKEKVACQWIVDTIFSIIEILGCFWYFLIVFSTGSEILEILQIYYC